jgi:hypothetical protein
MDPPLGSEVPALPQRQARRRRSAGGTCRYGSVAPRDEVIGRAAAQLAMKKAPSNVADSSPGASRGESSTGMESGLSADTLGE